MGGVRLVAGLFGHTVRKRSFGEFIFTERIYPPAYTTPPHAHELPLFCAVLEGGYEEHHQGKTRHCTSSTMLFHAAGEEHLERFDDAGGRSLIIEAAPSWFEKVCEDLPICMRTVAVDGGLARLAGSRLYEEFLAGDAVSPLVIEGLLLQLTADFFRILDREPRAPRWLALVTELLEARYREAFSLSAIGREVGAHPVHVAQVFRRFHGCTIGEYVRRMRVDFACRELAATDAPLAQIAAESGFADQSHFARTFRSVTGMSPSRYRFSSRSSAAASS